MSWLTDAFSAVGDVFSGGDVGSTLIKTGGMLAGQAIASDANEDAAARVAQAERERAQSIRNASLRADRRFQEQQDLARPGTERLRETVANPRALTPRQREGLEDLREDSRASLAASGLRGAGKAVTAALKDVESTYRNQALETNQARADRAAGQLSGQDFRAGEQAIRAETGGAVDAAGARAGGERVQAGATLANAGLRGAALGDVTSLISDQIKARGRQGRYGNNPYVSDDEEEEV